MWNKITKLMQHPNALMIGCVVLISLLVINHFLSQHSPLWLIPFDSFSNILAASLVMALFAINHFCIACSIFLLPKAVKSESRISEMLNINKKMLLVFCLFLMIAIILVSYQIESTLYALPTLTLFVIFYVEVIKIAKILDKEQQNKLNEELKND